jgi:hypothetical protein
MSVTSRGNPRGRLRRLRLLSLLAAGFVAAHSRRARGWKPSRVRPASREALFKRVSEQGVLVRAASEDAGIGDRRARAWVRRARCKEPFTDRSSRPHSGRAIPPALREQVIRLRRERPTMQQAAAVVGSNSSVARICRKAGLSRLRNLEPPEPTIRYERDHPGDLLDIDTKRLGRSDQPDTA